MRRGITFLTIAAVAAALAACGDDEPAQAPQKLEPQETRTVAATKASVRSYCMKVGLAIAGRRPRPTADDDQLVFDAVDRLIAIAQKKPDAADGPSSTPRDVIADTAEDLDGTNCSRALVRRLEAGLASLPAP